MHAIYKCRMCHKRFETGYVVAHKETAVELTAQIANTGEARQRPFILKMQRIHECKNGSVGIADFLGFAQEGRMQ